MSQHPPDPDTWRPGNESSCRAFPAGARRESACEEANANPERERDTRGPTPPGAFTECLPVACLTLDGGGHWLDADDRMAEWLGIDDPRSIRGRHFGECLAEDSAAVFREALARLARDGRLRGDLGLRRGDGRILPVHLEGRPESGGAAGPDRVHCVLVALCATDGPASARPALPVGAARDRRDPDTEWDGALPAITQLLEYLNHELRTPLNAVLGLAHLLEREPLAPGQAAMVRHISEAGENLLDGIADILDFCAIEAGRLHPRSAPFDPGDVLARVESLLRPSAEARHLAFRVRQPARTWLLRGDPERLEQVLVKLTGNAIKFTRQGGVQFGAKVLGREEERVRLRFIVRDTGIGLPKDPDDRLFLPFSQADAAQRHRYGGIGLGLPISRRLIRLMGGELHYRTQAGKGTLFWFDLDFPAASAGDERGRPPVGSAPAAPVLAGLRILVVEDNPINQMVVERMLKLEGAEVTLAGNGQVALDILQDHPHRFGLVLMDIQMPVMDGLAATRALRQRPALARLPIIALTASVVPEEREAAFRAGADAFLAKPLKIRQLLDALPALLETTPPPG